ncbi:hypothetical protein [Afifella aestuarii]|uniref:hypothetical protein n=1 Tax=Afifella aestuarii TaxID=1909496 RepID=UPI000FE2D729|nr:hypothetical protein [Afifella aestuarii]
MRPSVAAAALLCSFMAGTGHADTLGIYSRYINAAERMSIALSDRPADPARCPNLEDPREGTIYLSSGYGDPVDVGSGCWAPRADYVITAMSTYAGESVVLTLPLEEISREDAFDLWPTANRETWERQASAVIGFVSIEDEGDRPIVAGLSNDALACGADGTPGYRVDYFLAGRFSDGPIDTGCWVPRQASVHLGGHRQVNGARFARDFPKAAVIKSEHFRQWPDPAADR